MYLQGDRLRKGVLIGFRVEGLGHWVQDVGFELYGHTQTLNCSYILVHTGITEPPSPSQNPEGLKVLHRKVHVNLTNAQNLAHLYP